jgi:glycosyltransferase involved in cell wall biosynthesis
MISLIIPSYNNLQHLKNAYASVKKHAPQAEVILLDDGSTDGTWEWIWETAEAHQHREVKCFRSEERVGHTILYDKGIEMATNEIVGILHADMILASNYLENMLKHLKPGTVVCATRIEPPLHPPGKEKIVQDFGLDFDTVNIEAFEQYTKLAQQSHKDKTTRGMFAPWILYKKDFQAIGGHDPLFAPFPYEDSDIFQRWILAGYELIQSRDAFVYHLTCRGHRWNEQVGKDDDYYKVVSQRAARNYLRKWGSWIKNDEYQYPIIPYKYNIAFVVKNCNLQALHVLEPWCDRIYIEDDMQVLTDTYINQEQQNTKFDLKKRVLSLNHNYPEGENDIVVIFDARNITNESFNIIQNLSDIITESGEEGTFQIDCFEIIINNMTTYEKDLIVCSTS